MSASSDAVRWPRSWLALPVAVDLHELERADVRFDSVGEQDRRVDSADLARFPRRLRRTRVWTRTAGLYGGTSERYLSRPLMSRISDAFGSTVRASANVIADTTGATSWRPEARCPRPPCPRWHRSGIRATYDLGHPESRRAIPVAGSVPQATKQRSTTRPRRRYRHDRGATSWANAPHTVFRAQPGHFGRRALIRGRGPASRARRRRVCPAERPW